MEIVSAVNKMGVGCIFVANLLIMIIHNLTKFETERLPIKCDDHAWKWLVSCVFFTASPS